MKILRCFLLSILGMVLILPLFQQSANSQTAPTSTNSFYNIRYGNVGIATIGANGAAGTYQTIYTAPTAGAMIKGLIVSNEDTSTAHVVTCQITTSGGTQGIVIPSSAAIGAQTGSIPPFNMWSSTIVPGLPIDQWGNPFIYLPSGDIVKCTYTTGLSNGYIGVTVIAGEF